MNEQVVLELFTGIKRAGADLILTYYAKDVARWLEGKVNGCMRRSIAAYQEALKYMPGGVNSPVRAFKSVGMNPVFIERGKGSKVYDIDGNQYIDYVGSWGPLIAGHAHPEVVQAIKEVTEKGTSFGAPTLVETELAKLVVERVPGVTWFAWLIRERRPP